MNRRLANLLGWLAEALPDVACLQETRSIDAGFPVRAVAELGYEAVFTGQARWNGVAILSRIGPPVLTRTRLPGDDADEQCRYIEAAVAGILVGCLYAPNGNPQPGPKFAYKLRWLERLQAHAATLIAAGVPAVLAGDYNVIPTDADVWRPAALAGNALLQPQARAAWQALLAQGWADALREAHPSTPIYTFWDYTRDRWARNAGLRLDHLLLSPALLPRFDQAGVDRAVRGRPGASDHAPAWVALG